MIFRQRTKFNDAQRAEFNLLQSEIKHHLPGVETIVAIWAMMDLVYYLASLPQMMKHKALMASALRSIASLIEEG